MRKTYAVYLSGNIKKSHHSSDSQSTFWGDTEKYELCKNVHPHTFILLDPSQRTDDLNDSKGVLGRDFLMVFIADAVIVDARDIRGVGVGAEIDRAETQNIPVISVVPKNSAYHQFNTVIINQLVIEYKHPFICELVDYVAKNFEEAADWLLGNIIPKSEFTIKHLNKKIIRIVQHYIRKQLPLDKPMLELCNSFSTIKQRVDYLNNMDLA